MEVVIFIGIQGSGKTTFYKERFFSSHMRINLDMLRTRHREKLLFNACLEAKAKVVVDNTNTSSVEREVYIKPAKQAQFRIFGYYFIPDVEGSLHRNETRTESEQVPKVALLGTWLVRQAQNFLFCCKIWRASIAGFANSQMKRL